MAKDLMTISGLINLFSFTRKNIILPSILNTKRAKHRDTQINRNRRTAHRDQRAKTPKCIIFPHTDERVRKTIKINAFLLPTSYAQARRTLGNAYLSMVSEGDRSPPVTAAAKKEAPSGTHGRGVVCEQGRTRKTTVRCYVFALESRPGSHV